ncbi:hypothetical protein Pla110_24130 [Polystyrenella longa]|uniref:DUF2062 domain-containing protein n=1 Tax=Polystyrenella longa TaxID=2528007 RepID=A0A518CN70_9PLAN|nr:DUF2062 domain-containing protein [Polystyrenella longa]QDU80681.1 hypothetical protein Pla110_24130 [Polystyrenella longa]
MERPPKLGLKWYSSPRKLLRAILMLDDSRHSIALGTAIGIGIGMTPTVGIQMLIVLLVSLLTRRLFQFNIIAAMIAVYISNPLTMVPIYYFDYQVGSLLMDGEAPLSRLSEILHNDANLAWWNQIYALLVEFGWPLVLGSLVIGCVSGLLTYPAMNYLLKSFRLEKKVEPPKVVTPPEYVPSRKRTTVTRQTTH